MNAYRAEIDGLRALAVLAVVLFHARIPGVSGGFVGVDVFFVVSGYLITRLIRGESEAGAFSLARFYERRVRRIMPALFAVLAVCTAAALILLPGDLDRFAKSLAAVVAFVSNFLFWRWSGYFEPAAASSPLLHTWSLAVEEQFYIVFPLCAAFLLRRGRRAAIAVIAFVALASFAYSAWAATHTPDAAFYSPLSRAWELMLGALLALEIAPPPGNRIAGDAMAALGLGLIVTAIVSLTDSSPFPGLNALAPCLGTALVIYGTQNPASRLARLLGFKPVAAVGLISYSLYLWHWPLIVFGTYYVLDPGWLPPVRVAMALLSFPLAWLSWRTIERPFRGAGGLWPRRTLFVRAGIASLAFAAVGFAGYMLNGLPQRFDKTVQRLAAGAAVPDYACVNQPPERFDAKCLIGDSRARPQFVLWGDSHAAVYAGALDALARKHAVSGYNFTAFGTPPLLALAADGAGVRSSLARNERIMKVLARERPRVVILAAEWPVYFHNPQDDPRTVPRKHGIGYSPERMFQVLERTALALKRLGIAVYFVEDVPLAALSAPDRLAKARVLGRTQAIEPRTADYVRANGFIREAAARLERRGLLHIATPAGILCGPRTCRVLQSGEPLYFDSNHLSEPGARLVAPVFAPALEQASR